MKKIFLIILSLFISLFLFAMTATSAFALGGMSISDMMKVYGISRVIDRIIDLRAIILSSLEISTLVPDEYRSPGYSAFNNPSSLSKKWQREQKSYYKLSSNSYLSKLLGNSQKSVVGPVMMGGNISSGKESSYLKSYNWKNSGVKATDQTQKLTRRMAPNSYNSAYTTLNDSLSLIDINETLDQVAEDTLGDSYTDSMKSMGTENLVSSAAIMQGILSQPYAIGSTKIQRAYLTDYTMQVGGERLERIVAIISEAEAIRDEVKESHNEKSLELISALADSLSSFSGESGAWKAIASSYTTIAQDNILRQQLVGQIYNLITLNIRMRNQYFATFIYDYVRYTKAQLENESGGRAD